MSIKTVERQSVCRQLFLDKTHYLSINMEKAVGVKGFSSVVDTDQLYLNISGSTCTTISIIMEIHIGPSCHSKPELRISDNEQELRSELEKSKEKFHELKERFLVSEATVYSMANELKKHNCQKFKDIIESVLGEKLQYKEESLAEKLSLAENLKECSSYIQDQDQKLSLFHQKLQQGRYASFLLCQHLKELFNWGDPNTSQGHSFHDILAVGCRLAEDLA
ncbi:putative neuroblastoma breakpoint family member 5 [Octodon degus]|uniref:Neuroblastoma breakpoint family member 5 n=1 Tax=Octodon degus TaxID=10160 RepID=A0A6P6DXN6_OCTDE|nr:putative neuroblastoma breakpoint family member 5 [Octodon degus]